MKPAGWFVLFVSGYALVSTTLVVARQSDSLRALVPPIWACEEDMHEYYVRRFESAEGFGLSRMPQPPMLDRSGVLQLGGRRYSIDRLELVGLQTASEPTAFVPLRHQLPFKRTDFQLRRLASFELRALGLLRSGQSVVRTASVDPGSLEIMGALRGDGSCLKCHKDAREGDLLGAFSYRLRQIEGDSTPESRH